MPAGEQRPDGHVAEATAEQPVERAWAPAAHDVTENGYSSLDVFVFVFLPRDLEDPGVDQLFEALRWCGNTSSSSVRAASGKRTMFAPEAIAEVIER